MHKYYFKIRKGNTELEFSTDILEDFDTKVLEWVDNICKPEIVEENGQKYQQRMDFIDIKDLAKIPSAKNKNYQKEEFEQLLNESIEKPKLNLDKNIEKSNGLSDIITSKNITNPMDYIIITGFYILNYENTLRFTIKQINHRLVPLGITPVTHKEFQDALMAGYIEIVPDLTGMGDVTEYALTTPGEDYYNNGL